MVLVRKADRRKILEFLFKEGVMVVKKDPYQEEHPDIPGVRNLHVMMVLKSLNSKEMVKEVFCWQYYYYTLNPEGIEHLRELLHLPPQVFPATLTKRRAGRPDGEGGEGGGGKSGGGGGEKGGWSGKGYGRGKGAAEETK